MDLVKLLNKLQKEEIAFKWESEKFYASGDIWGEQWGRDRSNWGWKSFQDDQRTAPTEAQEKRETVTEGATVPFTLDWEWDA